MMDARAQLTALQTRKAKADALGPKAIAAARRVYDDICDQIVELEYQIATGRHIPLRVLIDVIHDTLTLPWPGTDRQKRYNWPDALTELERKLTDAANAGNAEDFIRLAQAYRVELARLNEHVNRPPEQQSMLTDGFEIIHSSIPWEAL